MLAAAAISLALLVASRIAIEFLRGRIDARRVRETGIGGTQDIGLWGMLVTLVLIVITVTLMYLAAAELRERQNARTVPLPHSELGTPQC